MSNKGQEFLIRAVQEVILRHPHTTFLLVGDGPMRRDLEELVVQLALENHVKFLGERTDVPALLALADIFVLPSFIEGLSVALLEAMAAAQPVVATAVAGNVVAICRLLSDPPVAKRIIVMGAVRVKDYFDFQKITRDIERLYDALLREHVSAG